MTHWNYLATTLSNGTDRTMTAEKLGIVGPLQEMLDKLGEDGWEIACACTSGLLLDTIIFKQENLSATRRAQQIMEVK